MAALHQTLVSTLSTDPLRASPGGAHARRPAPLSPHAACNSGLNGLIDRLFGITRKKLGSSRQRVRQSGYRDPRRWISRYPFSRRCMSLIRKRIVAVFPFGQLLHTQAQVRHHLKWRCDHPWWRICKDAHVRCGNEFHCVAGADEGRDHRPSQTMCSQWMCRTVHSFLFSRWSSSPYLTLQCEAHS